MATKTTNYNFNKPEKNEYLDIDVLTGTFDEIDAAMKDVEDKIDNLEIPTPDVSGQIETHNTSEDAHEGILAKADHTHGLSEVGITYGTDDLTAGTSSLETGKIYLVYE